MVDTANGISPKLFLEGIALRLLHSHGQLPQTLSDAIVSGLLTQPNAFTLIFFEMSCVGLVNTGKGVYPDCCLEGIVLGLLSQLKVFTPILIGRFVLGSVNTAKGPRHLPRSCLKVLFCTAIGICPDLFLEGTVVVWVR